ncbi:hypothetical protein [Photorhabdus asymbiotica]|uniref:hypothetical protein n=1 Tax=Photorhabdus asymbiotica TaxID=291112 RepID=UPI003DA70573
MKLETLLKKHFDIEINNSFDAEEKVYNEIGKSNREIWIYEKGNDSEPLLILSDNGNLDIKDNSCLIKAMPNSETIFFIKNIYSTLECGALYTESELKKMVKAGKIKSQYD